jgi:hypothetical protein
MLKFSNYPIKKYISLLSDKENTSATILIQWKKVDVNKAEEDDNMKSGNFSHCCRD